MVFKEKVIFPDMLAFGAIGGRGWSTGVVRTGGGQVFTNQNWSVPIGQWRVSLQNRNDKEIASIRGFVNAVRGQAFGFRFKAPLDFHVTNVPTRRLTSNTFQMQQLSRGGGGSFYLDVKKPKPNDRGLIVTLGRVPTTDYALNTTTGVLTIGHSVPTSVVPHITGDYHIPVILGVDRPNFEHTTIGYATWDDIDLFEIPL